MGIKGIGLDHIKDLRERNSLLMGFQPIPINKVGEYCEVKEGKITLLIEYNNEKTLSILNNRVGIAIATKSPREARGKLAFCKTRMKL